MLKAAGTLDEDTAKNYFGQLMSAISHMHEQNIAHRDIKLENILLDEKGNVKLADFGYSAKFTPGKLFEDSVGTTNYFAPEIHAGIAHSGESADIFACGVILFTMLTGNMPFSQADQNDNFYSLFFQRDYKTFWDFHERVMRKKVRGFKFSKDFKDFMNKIFNPDFEERATMSDIKKHPWVRDTMIV